MNRGAVYPLSGSRCCIASALIAEWFRGGMEGRGLRLCTCDSSVLTGELLGSFWVARAATVGRPLYHMCQVVRALRGSEYSV